MTLYLLFTGLGILIYIGITLAQAAASSFGRALVASGLVAASLAASREPGALREASTVLATESQVVEVGGEPARALAAGRTLFQERGCVSCHRPDATGLGPTLYGLFGSAVQDPSCGVATVDESYLRDSILNPLATVAAGFPPVMPSFAGRLTEEELDALVVYLKSLGGASQ